MTWKRLRSMRAICGCVALAAASTPAWWGNGHHTLTTAAVFSLRNSPMPAFFADGVAMVAHCSVDPDLNCICN